MEYLSNIELYYSAHVSRGKIVISGEEKNHISLVMRHSKGEKIYVTDGRGKIYLAMIKDIKKDIILAEVTEEFTYQNKFSNIFFCIPKLKNPERFEFALEKATEMGITNFIIYNSRRGVSRGDKKERWEKIVISAMKQSLRPYQPDLFYINSLLEIKDYEGIKIVMEQNVPDMFSGYNIDFGTNHYFIFGPEGGLDAAETAGIGDYSAFSIAPNRLRTETAIIKTASLITV